MAREKLFMLKNLQIQERWSNQKKLKPSSDDLRLSAKTNCENLQSRKQAEGRGSKILFSLISNAQSMMHGPGGMVARRKTSRMNFGAGPFVTKNLLVGSFNP